MKQNNQHQSLDERWTRSLQKSSIAESAVESGNQGQGVARSERQDEDKELEPFLSEDDHITAGPVATNQATAATS